MIAPLNASEISAELQSVRWEFSVEKALYLTYILVLTSIFVFGTVVNFIVFIIFYRRPSLRSISNRFVLSLTSANLLSALIVAPVQGLRIGRQVMGSVRNPRGECLYVDPTLGVQMDWWCQSCRILTTIATEASILSVLVIAIDRYCAVTSPLHYSMTVTRGRSIRLISMVWGVSFLYSLPLVVAKFTHRRKDLPSECWPEQSPVLVHRFGLYYSALLGLFGFAIPFLVLVWIYIKMYRAALKNSKRTRRHSVSANPSEIILPDCPLTPETANHNSVKGSKSKVQRKRSSNSSISSLFFREEGKAVKTGVIVIFSFITSWMPYYVYKVFETFYCYFPHLQNCVILLALSSSCTMPFIYVYRNVTAKKEALKVVCWWRPYEPATPTFQRSSFHTNMGNGHSTVPVRIIEPDTGTLYSYATVCKECGVNQLVSSLKSYRPLSTPVQELRRQSSVVRRESASFLTNSADRPPFLTNSADRPSFLTNSADRPPTKCKVCNRQDSASSGSSDDPILGGDRYKFARNGSCSARWMRPRSSNGSVTTRSDSLASTNSSVLSYGVNRWPRRCSTFSSDSGGTNSRRSGIEDILETPPHRSCTPRSCYGRNQNSLSVDYEDDECEATVAPDFHVYTNPFRTPRLNAREESIYSTNRFIWEIEEADGCDEDTFVIEKEVRPTGLVYGSVMHQQPREMEDIMKLKDIKRARMFRKRFSQQEMGVGQASVRRYSGPALRRPEEVSKNVKLLKEEENRSLKIRDTNKILDKFHSSDRSSIGSSIMCCDSSSRRKPTDL